MGTECCQRRQALIVACSGASDLGALTDQAARALAREGRAHMSCLAGIGAGLSKHGPGCGRGGCVGCD
jgi:uncharacterized metal-binding protein